MFPEVPFELSVFHSKEGVMVFCDMDVFMTSFTLVSLKYFET